MEEEIAAAGGSKEAHIMGIDEAGRGPVLGPMVYAACLCPKSKLDLFSKLGFADSKQLTAERRDQLFALIKRNSWIVWLVDAISPEEVSAKMLGRTRSSLNAIAHASAIGLIQRAVEAGIDVAEVYVDPVGPCESYQAKLQTLFPGVHFVVENQADSKFPIVSAASICAKVTRDRALAAWEFKESGMEISRTLGSGYPHDPDTTSWLLKHLDPVFGFPSLVRFSWKTTKALLTEKAVPFDWGENDEEPQGASPQQQQHRIQSFFAPSTASGERQVALSERPLFFRQRQLNVVCSFRPLH